MNKNKNKNMNTRIYLVTEAFLPNYDNAYLITFLMNKLKFLCI